MSDLHSLTAAQQLRSLRAKAVEKYSYTHKKQTGGSGQFAKVLVTVEPLE
ncbi:hypothetical protein ABZX92_37850, partial [Lentzea sp. NPDC006480]